MRDVEWGRLAFVAGWIALGALSLVYGDFTLQWQPVPDWVPLRAELAYASGALMVLSGAGLLFKRWAAVSSRVVLVYLVLWLLLLKWPRVARAPLVEASWLGLGEIAVLMAGGWVLFAVLSGESKHATLKWLSGARGVRLAQLVFGVALLPIGLAHLVYVKQTAGFIPAWIPWHTGWTWFTGVAHIAAGLGVLFGIYPRLAAALEAGMIQAFTLLVWLPMVLAAPSTRLNWTGFVISWAIGAGAWVVADSYRGTPWLARRRSQ
jgi:uncharacterized membrane protein